MGIDRVQFQKGLSTTKFMEHYGILPTDIKHATKAWPKPIGAGTIRLLKWVSILVSVTLP